MAIIHINGNEFDPIAQSGILQQLGIERHDASGSDYILVQTLEPMSDEQKERLVHHGAEIMEYVSPCTYLCRVKLPGLTELTDLRGLDFVTWVNVYPQCFVVPPYLKGESTQQTIVTGPQPSSPGSAPSEGAEAQSAFRSLTIQHTNQYTQCENLANRTFVPCFKTTTKREIEIVLHSGLEPTAGIVSRVATAAEVDTHLITRAGAKLRVHMQERFLDEVAKLDEVYFMEEVLSVCLHDDRARAILGADDVFVQGTSVLRGRGQVVAVADTGFDKGDLSDPHPAIGYKIRALYDLGRQGQTNDPAGHGTHVCGSVVGDGIYQTSNGPQRIQGTAPEASLVVQSLFRYFGRYGQPRLRVPPNLGDLFHAPYEYDGARIHNNSWGTVTSTKSSGYMQSSREVDKFAYEHPDMVILFAAGNDCVQDSPYGQIRSQAFAKNCITVGASENLRPDLGIKWEDVTDDFPSPPEYGDLVADQADGMAPISSRGDKLVKGMYVRIKPDVVAPGSSILSARSRNLSATSLIGQVPNAWGYCDHNDWLYLGGTSMATALVSGCCAVLRENLLLEGITSPSSALIKALLINGATDLVGQYPSSEAGRSPNPSSGWGRVNLQNSLVSYANPYAGYFEEIVNTALLTCKKAIPIKTPPREPYTFKATLVWTDPPSQPGQNGYQVLQNSLGLASRVNRRRKHGNREEGGLCYDLSNNVQQVVWEDLKGPHVVDLEVLALHLTLGEPQAFSVAWRVY